MSILNRPGDGNRSVLTVIYRLLVQEGPLDYEKIISLCAPIGMVDPKETRQTLNTWCDLKLFSKDEQRISIDPSIRKPERHEEFLPMHACIRVLMPENNERFWEIENSKASDFCRAVSWLLAQDVYTFNCNSWKDAQDFIKLQANDPDIWVRKRKDGKESHLICTNDTRWSGLKDWANYLGFAWTSRVPHFGSFIIDPTNAIRSALPQVFSKAETLTANRFIEEISYWIPVLDGGTFRNRIEEELQKNKGERGWVVTPSEQISTSLSRALLRLESLGILKCEDKADAPERLTLTGRNRSAIRTFSHFSLLK